MLPKSEDWIALRIEVLRAWIIENCSHVEIEQKHLDHATPEQLYWHYGYLCALRDVMKLDFHQGEGATR